MRKNGARLVSRIEVENFLSNDKSALQRKVLIHQFGYFFLVTYFLFRFGRRTLAQFDFPPSKRGVVFARKRSGENRVSRVRKGNQNRKQDRSRHCLSCEKPHD